MSGQQTWKFTRLVDFLDQHGIAVTVKGGQPRLTRPPTMPQSVFLRLADQILDSLAVHRDELCRHFLPTPEVTLDPDIIYRSTPPESVRLILWRRWLAYHGDHGGRLLGYSCYTRAVEPVGEPTPATPPRHWSKVGLELPTGTFWQNIPNHSPPCTAVRSAKRVKRAWWKPPPGWKPERDWLKPKGFKMPKRAPPQRHNPWSEQLTYKGQLPD